MADAEAGNAAGRRVLMVSYNYPPVGAIGAVRTTKLAKYLPARGWEPTVLTVTGDRTKWGGGDATEGVLPGVNVVRAPFPDPLTFFQQVLARLGLVKPGSAGEETELLLPSRGDEERAEFLKRGFRWAKRWLAFPDRYQLWLPFAFWKGLSELRSKRYDAIYSSAPPVCGHIVARSLQKASGLPWLADYRDPWTLNPLRGYTALQKRAHGMMERSVTGRASLIVTATESWAADLARFLDRPSADVQAVSSGYDPDDFPGQIQPLEGRFVITYTGTIHWLERGDPGIRAVLGTLDELSAEKGLEAGEVLLRFFGPHSDRLEGIRNSLSRPWLMEINGVVPRTESLMRQRESTALLLLMKDDPYSATLHTGKVFEYLGSRRPVLAWAPAGGEIAELLGRTGAGVAVRNEGELKQTLRIWLEEFVRTGNVAYRGREEELMKYSWPGLAAAIAEKLESIAPVRR